MVDTSLIMFVETAAVADFFIRVVLIDLRDLFHACLTQ